MSFGIWRKERRVVAFGFFFRLFLFYSFLFFFSLFFFIWIACLRVFGFASLFSFSRLNHNSYYLYPHIPPTVSWKCRNAFVLFCRPLSLEQRSRWGILGLFFWHAAYVRLLLEWVGWGGWGGGYWTGGGDGGAGGDGGYSGTGGGGGAGGARRPVRARRRSIGDDWHELNQEHSILRRDYPPRGRCAIRAEMWGDLRARHPPPRPTRTGGVLHRPPAVGLSSPRGPRRLPQMSANLPTRPPPFWKASTARARSAPRK